MLKKIILALSLASPATLAIEIEENQIDKGKVFAQGKEVTLLGNGVKVNQQAPNFKVVDAQFKAITLDDFSGEAVLINIVPSLDTGVCSLQTKFFNQEVQNNANVEDDIPGKIKKLSELKDQGILTQEEFDTKKADLLSKM